MESTKTRLDSLLVERGLFPSRSRAAAAVIAGDVRVGAGQTPAKPGQLVPGDVELEVAAGPDYVSRGGLKLQNALDALGIDVTGRHALDVGASTGGFTDCLLQRGAERAIALDVAYGELDWRLRNHPAVTVVERLNARRLEPGRLPFRPDFVTIDVSFISLTKVLGPVLACADPAGFDCLALVKPQFEAGRELVGRGGVVRDPVVRRETLVSIGEHARALGHSLMGFASSGLPGPAGNRESFAWIAEAGRRGSVEDVDAAARRAEP